VIPNFMIQGGGFTEDMTKLPTREPIKNEWTNGLKNVRGTLAMARLGGQADSATNQFFINVTDNAFLDKPRDGAGYAVFGAVIEGMDVADTIRQTPTQNDPRSRMQNVPIRPMIIEDVTEIEADELSDSAIADAREWMERTEQWVQAAEEAKARQAQRDQMQREQAATFVAEQYGLSMDDLTETDSGLMYATVEEGSGDNPESAAAEVTVHYTGWLTDGTKFDSSRDRGEPAQFPLNRVIPGWTEGVQSMNEGERRVLVIPFSLAYGEQGRPPRIPGRSMLIFDVELIDAGG
jgi:FKBP-type peptidyl-prolyl cis-trans isomerase